jgi:hypothetical protein
MTSYIQGKFNDININFFGCDIIKGHCDLINFHTLVLSDQAWLLSIEEHTIQVIAQLLGHMIELTSPCEPY